MNDTLDPEIMDMLQSERSENSEGAQAYFLSEDEKDTLGEIGNICMGTSATTLSTLLGKQVNITTPRVTVASSVKELAHYKKPYLAVEVSYTEGIKGYNILLMKEEDVKVITDLLMNGDGNPDLDQEIDELHFSAISEVMNQMVGSSSTALSNIVMRPVNITPPRVKKIVMEEDDLSALVCHDDTVIQISFNMEIEGVLKSELMQLVPYDFGKKLANGLMDELNQPGLMTESKPARQAAPPPPPVNEPMYEDDDLPMMPPQPQPQPVRQQEQFASARVGVKSMQYQRFDDAALQSVPLGAENINLILDVPLQITVELGKCKKSIKEILGFSMGSVIVLDRLAGELVDILVNGKLFARGEVVVIDDNYGVRVTDILASPQS